MPPTRRHAPPRSRGAQHPRVAPTGAKSGAHAVRAGERVQRLYVGLHDRVRNRRSPERCRETCRSGQQTVAHQAPPDRPPCPHLRCTGPTETRTVWGSSCVWQSSRLIRARWPRKYLKDLLRTPETQGPGAGGLPRKTRWCRSRPGGMPRKTGGGLAPRWPALEDRVAMPPRPVACPERTVVA